MVTFFKDNIIPSCSYCEYATVYIPTYSYPYSDPYCSKGHGKCAVDKVCDDFRLINTYFCEECDYCGENNYCNFHKKQVNLYDESCVYFKKNK